MCNIEEESLIMYYLLFFILIFILIMQLNSNAKK